MIWSMFAHARARTCLEKPFDRRPEGLVRPLVIEDVQVIVEYGSYPSALNRE